MAENYDFKYLIVSERDVSFGLWINTVGFQSIAPGSKYPLMEHPSTHFFNARKGRILHEFQLLYITKGEGFFESASTKMRKIEEGSLIMLYPDQWHTYSPSKSTGWNEYYIGFDGHVMADIAANGFFTPENQVIHIGFVENIVELFSSAIKIAKEDRLAAQQQLAGMVMFLLGKTLALSNNNDPEHNEITQKVEQAKVIMTEHVYGEVNPEEIARELNISYSWFRKIFKSYTGYAPAQYFKELKLNKAKELLSETNMTVKEVAFRLNFNSTEHFFSIFKRKTRYTPTEYRNSGKK